jgi:hypothetical protein
MEIAEKKIEDLEHSRVRMTLTIPSRDVRAEYDAMMN